MGRWYYTNQKVSNIVEEGCASRNESGWLCPRKRDFGTEKIQCVTKGLKSSSVKSESQQGLDSRLYSTTLRQILNTVAEALEHLLESML